MQAKIAKSNVFDVVKWSIVALLLVAGVVANYYFIEIPLPLRLVGWLVLVCISVLIAFQTIQGRRFWKFVRESRNEVRKVVWPNRQEMFQTTLLVIAVVVVFAIIMWGADSFLMWAMSWLTGQRG